MTPSTNLALASLLPPLDNWRGCFLADGTPKVRLTLRQATAYCAAHDGLAHYWCDGCRAFHCGHDWSI
jgi:hypothetical protein